MAPVGFEVLPMPSIISPMISDLFPRRGLKSKFFFMLKRNGTKAAWGQGTVKEKLGRRLNQQKAGTNEDDFMKEVNS